MNKNLVKYLVAFAVLVGTLGYFFTVGMAGGKVYYKEVGELVSDPASAKDKNLRVSGRVTHNNFTMDKFLKVANFEVADAKGNIMLVEYKGLIPDAFEEGADVVLEGSYDPNGNMFTTRKLLAKCPSKYEAEGDIHPDNVSKS